MELTRARIVNGVVGIVGSFVALFITDLIIVHSPSSQSYIFEFNSPAYADSSNLRTVDREVLDLILGTKTRVKTREHKPTKSILNI